MKIVFDLEADGLLEECTKIYCLCYHNLHTGESFSTTNYDVMRALFLNPELTAICHNAIRFDARVLEKILGIDKVLATIWDTLTLSWYLFPERKSHGLEKWGDDLGVAKPVIEDWHNLTIERYIERCEEDVKINTRLWHLQEDYLKELYEGEIDRIIGYLMFKMWCAREQEEMKWKLDVDKCLENIDILSAEKEAKTKALEEAMPQKINYRTANKPKKLYRADGTYSKLGEKWFALLEEHGLPEDHEEPIKLEKDREIGNPGSHDQMKSWLFSLGWQPETFKYEKEKDGNGVREIPQINLPFGQGICNSIKKLYDKEPALENLDKYYVISHRLNILKGFMRDQVDGYLQAQVKGLTNTLRFQHTELVNLPGVASQYGEYIRSVLICEDNQVLCGSDMSSLEDRTKQHYMYFFDPEYVESMIKPGFDPHLDLAEFAYEITNGDMGVTKENSEFFKSLNSHNATDEEKKEYKRIKGERHSFKTVNYAAVYGSGAPTMSRNSGMSEEKCAILIDAYWKKNWSVKKVSESAKVKIVHKQMWQYNPVSQFWYSLRHKKDKFSTLNQGTGVYCFDMWVRNARLKGVKMCGQFHDEIIAPCYDAPFDRQQLEFKLKESIKEVNDELKLNRELDIDVQFGKSYADIH